MYVAIFVVLHYDRILIQELIAILFYLSGKLRYASKDVLDNIILRAVANHLVEWRNVHNSIDSRLKLWTGQASSEYCSALSSSISTMYFPNGHVGLLMLSDELFLAIRFNRFARYKQYARRRLPAAPFHFGLSDQKA